MKQHAPLQRKAKTCPRYGMYARHNYAVFDGRREFVGDVHQLRCTMLTSRFGVTVEYLEQLHLRMLREHVSFAAEADVLRQVAESHGMAGNLPARLRKYLSQAWHTWRLMKRRCRIGVESMPTIDILQPTEAYIATVWPVLLEDFEGTTAQESRSAGTHTCASYGWKRAGPQARVCRNVPPHAGVWEVEEEGVRRLPKDSTVGRVALRRPCHRRRPTRCQ